MGPVAGGPNPRLSGGEGAFLGRRCGRTSMLGVIIDKGAFALDLAHVP